MVVGVVLIVFGCAIGALGRVTARHYASTKGAQLALWLLCLLVGIAVVAVGFTRM
ncbi:hypothetical protein ACGFZL_15020 [Streptomyces sp. NPDC048182]|uniref:hypothetical protein n=1 Tax=unclassified Streptomyces TaxID=2593676 RepID=UPI0033BB3272